MKGLPEFIPESVFAYLLQLQMVKNSVRIAGMTQSGFIQYIKNYAVERDSVTYPQTTDRPRSGRPFEDCVCGGGREEEPLTPSV